jgi:hypothetical protein
MDDLTKKKIENAKQILANGNCSGVECRFCFAYIGGLEPCKVKNDENLPISGMSEADREFFKQKIAEYEGSKMKYKVGDIVIAKKGLIPGCAYGSVADFVDGMVPYCGRQMKIKKVHKDHYDVEENYFGWTDEMLEPAEIFNPYYNKNTKNKQYHIGDKIRVHNHSEIFTITERTFSETGDIIYKAKTDKFSVFVNPSDIKPVETAYTNGLTVPKYSDYHPREFTIKSAEHTSFAQVNGMTFKMTVDRAVDIKKHETRKEIRKRLLKL